jgi:8-oxo-dGTP pyrophosphatase MutT (NUDIX family)
MDTREWLMAAFNNELPGRRAHLLMAPPNRFDERSVTLQPNCRNSSVMIMVYESNGQLCIPVIKRPSYNGVHSGQMSLPGGKWELCDESAWHAAVRETREEIGVLGDIEFIGSLSPFYIPHSNFMVYPFVGQYAGNPEFIPCAYEVECLVEVPLNDFFDIAKRDEFIYGGGDSAFSAPCYNINGHCIWGATAMIISEFVEALRPNMASKPTLHYCQIEKGA